MSRSEDLRQHLLSIKKYLIDKIQICVELNNGLIELDLEKSIAVVGYPLGDQKDFLLVKKVMATGVEGTVIKVDGSEEPGELDFELGFDIASIFDLYQVVIEDTGLGSVIDQMDFVIQLEWPKEFPKLTPDWISFTRGNYVTLIRPLH